MKRYIRSSVQDMSAEERVRLARSSNDPEVLAKLADDADVNVRYYVAKRADDPKLLAKLADDEWWLVRKAVAARTNDLAILTKLADDNDWLVREAVAEHTDDPAILAKLADDKSEHVRYQVASRADDPELLAKLADDEDKDVRKVVAKRQGRAYSRRRNKAKTSLSWPSSDWWYDLNDESFEDAWQKYLSDLEDEVNDELQILPEPSVQGSMGGLFVHDESGQDRKEEDENWYIDWREYLDWQVRAAATSKNASQYKKKYRKFMKQLCGI